MARVVATTTDGYFMARARRSAIMDKMQRPAKLSKLRRRSSGFTLVELMVVVVLVGVLSMTLLRVFDKQINSARGVEALAMVQSIRAAQESYRAMNSIYLDVSTDAGWYPRDPTQGRVGVKKTTFFRPIADDSHADNARWWRLKPTDSGPVQFGYMVNAGLPGEAMTEPAVAVDGLAWPAANEPWYVIQAIADADGDGDSSFYMGSSINGEVMRLNYGE